MCACVHVYVRTCMHVCMCACMRVCVHTCLCVYLGSRAVVGTAGGQVAGLGCRQVEPHGVAWGGLAGQGRGGCWVLGGHSGRQATDPSSLSTANTHSVIYTITEYSHRPCSFVNSTTYRTQLPWGHHNVQKNITDEETVHIVTKIVSNEELQLNRALWAQLNRLPVTGLSLICQTMYVHTHTHT